MSTTEALDPQQLSDRFVYCDLEHAKVYVVKDRAMTPQARSMIVRFTQRCAPKVPEIIQVSLAELDNIRVDNEGAKTHETSDMQRAARALFEKGVELGASDLHIRVSNRAGRTEIRFRVNNDLVMTNEDSAEFGQALANTIYQAYADVADATFDPNGRQDARIGEKTKLPEGLDGIRIATTPQVDGFVMVLRFLYDATGAGGDIGQLGYSDGQQSHIQSLKRRPTGINIVIGPTGSGKSTTLQRVLTSYIEETGGRKHVITVEDPPEYPIPGSVQTPVTGADTEEKRGKAFSESIKAAMRLDPDVLMIGEIRDTPSARLALQAAMTGHQVWATLHANGGFEAFDRLRDLGVEMPVLCNPSILSGLIAQRLLKKLCSCKRPYLEAIPDLAAKYGHEFTGVNERLARTVTNLEGVYVRGEGCECCRGSGVVGRTVISEVIVTDRELLDLVRKGETHGAIVHWKNKGGMTMMEHAIAKLEAGEADPFDVEEVVGELHPGEEASVTPLRKAA